jgi:glycerol uptake facilitator-like aquaporin
MSAATALPSFLWRQCSAGQGALGLPRPFECRGGRRGKTLRVLADPSGHRLPYAPIAAIAARLHEQARNAKRTERNCGHLKMSAEPLQKLLAEALGTALLLAIVIGSGIMAERLSEGNVAIALLGNTLATVCGLYVLIEVFGPISGAHFNPVVSLVMTARRDLSASLLAPYMTVQLLGAIAGAWLAHAMFDMSIIQFSTKLRTGAGQWIAEGVATFGLLLVILRAPAARASAMVAAYIGAAYWFTASTSFANPAAVLGRMFSDSFSGIAPASAPAFIVAQLIGAGAALGVHYLLSPSMSVNEAAIHENTTSKERHD